MTKTGKTKVVFEQIDRDVHSGTAQWEIRLETDGITEIVGLIEKSTCWCGDGYRADCYNVSVELEEWDDSQEMEYDVRNSWSGGKGMTARQALAACKAFAKRVLKEKIG